MLLLSMCFTGFLMKKLEDSYLALKYSYFKAINSLGSRLLSLSPYVSFGIEYNFDLTI